MIGNKKPRHPVGVFRIGSLGITPVVPYCPCAYLCSYYCVELPVPDESIIGNCSQIVQPQRAVIHVSKCVQDRLKTVPFLSAEIGDIFCPGKSGNIEKSFNLIEKQSNLLAEYLKTVLKKPTCFQASFLGLRPRFLIS